jgi:PAS domain S-box-containing protein
VKRLAGLEHTHPDLFEILEQLNLGLAARYPDGTILWANQRLCGWLGYGPEEVEGQHAEMVLPPELSEAAHAEMGEIEKGDLRVRLSALRRKDSTTFPVLLIPTPLFDEEGKFTGSLAAFVELASVQTAKRVGSVSGPSLRESLDRIALEISAVGLAADLTHPGPLALKDPELQALSPREKEVLAELAAGMRAPGIAGSLHISPHTVRNHLKAIYRKLGVKTQAELIERVRSPRSDEAD